MRNFLSVFFVLFASVSFAGNPKSKGIAGQWDIKGQNYTAIYQMDAYRGKYYGRLIEYTQAGKTIKGGKEDYFISDVQKSKGGGFIGKFYTPDGKEHKFTLTWKSDTELEAKIDIGGKISVEQWTKRK
ncbi:hypothetical protein FUAX_25920 [Fulvitalea axinellae]|uniref:DUF2147 domain-containing protein n=2 Tax=Fulvitalea axinellae TaxID=1182444 RepID=A0AAU9CLI3_9BACT|nr:hypothetical protein FUAX_25920 [Fulvitalea axinellae]